MIGAVVDGLFAGGCFVGVFYAGRYVGLNPDPLQFGALAYGVAYIRFCHARRGYSATISE